ncbi:hypothetical protein HZS_7232 [Henneguya salminicola]|nr:hypothetical protein HZS_7232 [Henneguya salminicola]
MRLIILLCLYLCLIFSQIAEEKNHSVKINKIECSGFYNSIGYCCNENDFFECQSSCESTFIYEIDEKKEGINLTLSSMKKFESFEKEFKFDKIFTPGKIILTLNDLKEDVVLEKWHIATNFIAFQEYKLKNFGIRYLCKLDAEITLKCENYVGINCGVSCPKNYFNEPAECDIITGQRVCRKLTFGPYCEKSRLNFYQTAGFKSNLNLRVRTLIAIALLVSLIVNSFTIF